MSNERKAKTAAKKAQKVHTHLLLWNLRALRNNVAYAPELYEGYRQSFIENHDALAPIYEAELKARGITVPAGPETDANREEWETALAEALATRH